MNKNPGSNAGDTVAEANRIGYLIAGYISQTLTDAEETELQDWVSASEENTRIFRMVTDQKFIEQGLKERGIYNPERALRQLRKGIKRQQSRTRKIAYIGLSAAATLILAVGAYTFFKRSEPAAISTRSVATATDVAPGGEHATLTLPDGRTMRLDTIQGTLYQSGEMEVINARGQISYSGAGNITEYHTITTPRGGQYTISLPDGSKVWLNAASRLTYPTVFTGTQREVRLTGEGYFEVNKDPAHKFVVMANGVITEVLGTHFNVNAYNSENDILVTLLEGSVNVATGRDAVTIQPGEQARTTLNNKLETKNVNTDVVVAWKNGMFEFEDEPIASVMQQISRWYDVEVEYKAQTEAHYTASVPRNLPLSKLLKWLEDAGHANFEIKDKKIIVKP